MNGNVAIILDRDLAAKMVRPWYLIKKREADVVREAFRVALDDNNEGQQQCLTF